MRTSVVYNAAAASGRRNMRKTQIWLAVLLILALGLTSCDGADEETPSPTMAPTPVITPAPTPTPLASPAPTPTPSPTPTGVQTLPDLKVHFIDVGQGDAILIDLGETEVLIDGGERDSGAAEYLVDHVDGALEAIVATNPHADHIGGLIDVMEAYEVEEVWWNGLAYQSQTYSDFRKALLVEEPEVRVVVRGNTTAVGDLEFTVLHPYVLGDDTNNNSVVLLLSYGDTGFLFMSDAEEEAEAELLVQSVVQIPDVDILKVGRHGSRTASSEAFLDAVQPEVAIYMAGEGNRYGHPHWETRQAFQRVGTMFLGTRECGNILVETDGREYTVSYRTITVTLAPDVTLPTSVDIGLIQLPCATCAPPDPTGSGQQVIVTIPTGQTLTAGAGSKLTISQGGGNITAVTGRAGDSWGVYQYPPNCEYATCVVCAEADTRRYSCDFVATYRCDATGDGDKP
jgi:competence protein ComEC